MEITITKILTVIYRLNGFEDYVFCEDENLYNLKNSKQVSLVRKNNCLGYNLNGIFFSRKKIELLKTKLIENLCPF